MNGELEKHEIREAILKEYREALRIQELLDHQCVKLTMMTQGMARHPREHTDDCVLNYRSEEIYLGGLMF